MGFETVSSLYGFLVVTLVFLGLVAARPIRIRQLRRRQQALLMRAIQLETGIRNQAALRLYRGSGYRDRGPFGGYADDGVSVSPARKSRSASRQPQIGPPVRFH